MNRLLIRTLAQGFLGAGTIALVWEVVPRVLNVRPALLPPFSSVVLAVGERWSLLGPHLLETAVESIGGFGIAVAGGSLLAVAVHESRWAERFLLYPTIALQNVPKVALAPLLVLWFAHGYGPKLAMSALIAFFPIFEGFRKGLQEDRTGLRGTLSVLGPSRWQMLIRVKLPEAIPTIFQGLPIGITFATIGAIVGEMAQPSSGLGFLIDQGKENFDTRFQFAAVLVVSILGLLLYGGVVLVEVLFFRRYRRRDSQLEGS